MPLYRIIENLIDLERLFLRFRRLGERVAVLAKNINGDAIFASGQKVQRQDKSRLNAQLS